MESGLKKTDKGEDFAGNEKKIEEEHVESRVVADKINIGLKNLSEHFQTNAVLP